jgi:hypothetical protein
MLNEPPLYTTLYKNADGTTTPITLADWATKALTGDDLTACQNAITRQTQFRTTLASYATIPTWPMTNNDTTALDMSPAQKIADSALYCFYNFIDALVEYMVNDTAQKYNINLNSIDPNILSRWKQNRKANHLRKYCVLYGDNTNPQPNIHALLKYNGSNAVELQLDKSYPGFFTSSPPTFLDQDWEKYQAKFLSDPNVVFGVPATA